MYISTRLCTSACEEAFAVDPLRLAQLWSQYADPNPGGSGATTRLFVPSKAAIERPPSRQNDFEFLNFSHPSEAKASGARKTVRSHVTRQQHQRGNHERENQAVAARRSSTLPIKSESCTPNDLQSLRSILTFIPDTLNYVQEPLSARTTRSDSAMLDNRDFLIPLHHSLIGPQAQMLICALCPINWQDCAFEIVDHYIMTFTKENIDVEGELGLGSLRRYWVPLVLSDAVTLYAVLLLSSSHLRMQKDMESCTSEMIDLRGLALRTVNEQVQSKTKRNEDAVFAAILTLAVYEVLFGDLAAYSTHMTGLQNLAQLRGGLDNLGLSGLMCRMLLYVDSNGSAISGQALHFPKYLYPIQYLHPEPNPSLFGPRCVIFPPI